MISKIPLVISGSARHESDTKAFVDYVFEGVGFNEINLLDYCILPYNYEEKYPMEDEFSEIVNEILDHEIIVFATPVYWYAMSGTMKVFFDRLSDLISSKKQIGKQLKGRAVLVMAVGSDKELPEGFEVPFKLTSEYLDMNYKGCVYSSTKHPLEESEKQLSRQRFIERMNSL